MNLNCILFTHNQQQYVLHNCLRFSLVRERYQAFSTLRIHMLADADVPIPCAVILELDQIRLMHGIVQNAVCIRQNNHRVLQITAVSYSAALTKNQLEPGLYTRVTLRSLMQTYALPYISYDENVPEISYIFVKDNAAMWDSIIAYNYKLNHGFPYLRCTNLLCMLPQTGSEPIRLPADRFLHTASGGSCADMVSRIDMANMAGEYGSFTRTNPRAAERNIVRVRQILLDKQYLYDPDDALKWRIALSNRKLFSKSVSYAGYCGEDLEDLVQAGDFVTARVSRIVMTGDERGIITTDTFYFDDFCNNT
ncbi:MAG TPA: hypothetical protein DCG49_06690 [Ruminococcus sp.]|nr:hypothetical protein [Ruminococcus sp.]